MPTKLEQALELLRSEEGADLSHAEAARRLNCSDAHIRRARAVIEAQDRADRFSDDPNETARLLVNVVNASEAVEIIDKAIDGLKKEGKELKKQRKELAGRLGDAVQAARETHPLFDRKKPSLAATG